MGKSKKAKQAEASEEEKPERSWLMENIEAILVAIVLALIIRHFATEAFVIPTGSMAPTLLGEHYDLECPNCDKDQPYSYKLGDRRFKARCSNCGYLWTADRDELSLRGGYKILVNKFIYDFRPPRRYEVVVFKFPVDPERNFIKRLVGLPGEELNVLHGNLYVDGELAPKPLEVQEELWREIHSSRYQEKELVMGPAWLAEGEGSWERRGTGFSGKAEEGERAVLRYLRPIADWNDYNTGALISGSNVVGEVRLRARCRASEGATLSGRIRQQLVSHFQPFGFGFEGPNPRELRFEVTVGSDGGGSLLIGDEVVAEGSTSLPVDEEVELAFSNADGVLLLTLDGEVILEAEYDVTAVPLAKCDVQLAVSGGSLEIEELAVDRDIFYLPDIGQYLGQTEDSDVVGEARREDGGSEFPIQLGDDEYFMMGDNTSNSQDGRTWGPVPEPYLSGRAFFTFWPALPDFHLGRIR